MTNLEIAKHMIENCLDYHNLPNGNYIVAFADGIWIMDSNDYRIEQITSETWIK